MSDIPSDEPEVTENPQNEPSPEPEPAPEQPTASESVVDAEFQESAGDQAAEENLADEFRDLGKNLIVLLQTAWDRPERRKFQQDLETNISELGNTLRKEAHTVADSQISQRIKSEFDDLSGRVRSGEVEAKVRGELLSALRSLNTELTKISSHLSSTPAQAPTEETPAESPQEAGEAPPPAAES